jgi:hypothetical protein
MIDSHAHVVSNISDSLVALRLISGKTAMYKAITAISIMLLVSGCAHSISDWRPTMEADPAETGAEGFIYMDELSKAYQDGSKDNPFCNYARESYQEREKYTLSRYKTHPEGKPRQSARKDFRCLVFRDLPSGNDGAPAVRAYSLAGFALSDLYCRNFFRRVGAHASKRGFGRDVINDVGTAMAAILGLASAGSAATGGVAAGFGIAESGFADYDKEFLVSADLPSVEKQVIATQQDYMKTYLDAKMPGSYFEAAMAIQQHANFCSFLGMRALITDALTAATTKKSGSNPDEGSAVPPAAPVTLKQWSDAAVAFGKAKTTYDNSKKQTADLITYQEAKAAYDKSYDSFTGKK